MAVTFTCDGIRSFTAKKSSVDSTAWNQTAYASTLSEGGQAGPHTTSGVNYVSVTVLRFAVPSISYSYDSYSFKIKFKYVSNLSEGAKGTVYFYLKDPTKTSGTNYQPVYDSSTGHYLTGTSNNKVIGSANFTLSNTNS